MEQRFGSSSQDILTEPVRGGRNLTTEQKTNLDLSAKIDGWGVDIDPDVRPGVPRDKARMVGIETLYPSFEQQVPDFKIFKSTEHGQLTPVFGTSCPPRALSGLLRARAYKLSEGRVPHWLMLMTADRVDVVEGLLEDFAQFRIPNLYKEMGLRAEFKYNKAGVAKKLLALGGVTLAAIGIWKYFDNRADA